MILDYPLLNTAGRGSKDDAAAGRQRLVAAASSVDGRTRCCYNSSFRDPGGSGFSAKVTVLDGGDAALVDKTLRAMAGARYPDPHHLHDRHVRVDARPAATRRGRNC